MIELAALTADHFRPLIGQDFQLELAPGAPVTATLVEVQEHAAWAVPGFARVPFAIGFRVPHAPSAGRQGTYPLTHPELGRFELFFTLHRSAGDGVIYDAAFS